MHGIRRTWSRFKPSKAHDKRYSVGKRPFRIKKSKMTSRFFPTPCFNFTAKTSWIGVERSLRTFPKILNWELSKTDYISHTSGHATLWQHLHLITLISPDQVRGVFFRFREPHSFSIWLRRFSGEGEKADEGRRQFNPHSTNLRHVGVHSETEQSWLNQKTPSFHPTRLGPFGTSIVITCLRCWVGFSFLQY